MGCGAVQNPQVSSPFSKNNRNLQLSNNKNSQIYNGSLNKIENSHLKSSQAQTMNHVYQIKQLLGKGTYGEVYRCKKNQTGEQFALKIVKLNAKNKEQAKRHVNNLKSQISVLKKLNHRNIVKYHSFDISPDNQTVQIVFQLIQDGSLKDYLSKNGPLTQVEASRFCKQILEGLDYLHQKSIIHRDLKCANILIGKNQVIKITDFGTAKQIKVKSNQDIARLCASLKGTPYYMAPQILKRSGHHKSADIWSFGCTLIQMLTGRPPWTTLTQNFEQIISYIISGIPPPLPPNMSKQCEFFLQSCFDSVPSQRLTAKQLLNHRFILMNTRNASPSLVYEKNSPKNYNKSISSNATRKKTQQCEVTDLNSIIQITKRKKSNIQNIQEEHSQLDARSNAFKKYNFNTTGKQNKSNMFLDSPKFNQMSEPYLNYYGATENHKGIDQSEPYISSKQNSIKKSKKLANNQLKKVAKTAGHVKMTQDNLLNWNEIQQQMISNRKDSKYQQSIGNTIILQNFKNTKNYTKISKQKDEVINTSLAKQERERYVQNQKKLKQKKEQQKQKWQQELKKQSITKKQISQKFIKGFH